MPLKTIVLFVFLFAIFCEKCSGQGRPFYRASLRTQQIIPEGPAWPASAREYANFTPGNSVRGVSTTTTLKPNGNSQQPTRRTNVNFGRPNKAQNKRNRFSWKMVPSRVEINSFSETVRSRPWGIDF